MFEFYIYMIINNMDHGIITGVFTVTKRGQDYGIKLINGTETK